MDLDTKRRFLTGCGIVLGVVMGAIITHERLKDIPRRLGSEVEQLRAEQIPGTRRMNKRVVLVNRNGATIWLKIVTSLRCESGDYDFIRSDLEKSNQTHLLLTLEPLFATGKGQALIHRPLKLEEIQQGFELNATLPYQDVPEHYGLFLCSDKNKTDTCHGKPLAVWDAAKKPAVEDDSLYFFSYLLLKGEELHVVDSTVHDPATAQIRDYLSKVIELDENEIQSVIGTISALNKPSKLRDVSVDVSESRIKIILPRRALMSSCSNIESYTTEMGANKIILRRGDTIEEIQDGKIIATRPRTKPGAAPEGEKARTPNIESAPGSKALPDVGRMMDE